MSKAIWSIPVAVVFLVVGYVTYLSPVSGDTWGHVERASGSSPLALWDGYLRSYFGYNPRIGQYALSISAISAEWKTAIGALSLFLLMHGGVMVSTGRGILSGGYNQTIAFFTIFSLTILAGTNMGVMFFYAPFVTNYVFGFGLLLVFLGYLRLGLEEGPSWWHFLTTIPLGILAGLSNEHTSPSFLGMATIGILLGALGYLSRRATVFVTVSFVSLLAGYLALFFAPGQNRRYGSIKYDGFDALFSDGLGRMAEIAEYASPAWPVFLAALIVPLAAWFLANGDETRKQIAISLISIAAAVGMAVTLAASPKLGYRLLFASQVAIAIAITAALHSLKDFKILTRVVGGVAGLVVAAFLVVAFSVYHSLSEAIAKYEEEVIAAQSAGVVDAVITPVDFDYRRNREFVWPDPMSSDSEHRLNKVRARYYGFETFRFEEQ